MIFYFSGTGNCQQVAEALSGATNESVVSIAECLRKQQFSFTLAEDERLGFVTPTYFLGLPDFIAEFIQNLELTSEDALENHYVYGVATYGTTPGSTTAMLGKELERKGIVLNGRFGVRMVDSWAPQFDCSDVDKNIAITEAAIPQIEKVAKQVVDRKSTRSIARQLPLFLGKLLHKSYKDARLTSHFNVNTSCIGCKLCATNCPVCAIEMHDSRPQWVAERCIMCLRCYHHCPKYAIQYDNKTQAHGQFVNPYFRK